MRSLSFLSSGFFFFSLPHQDCIFLSKLLDLVSKDLVCLCHMIDFFHLMIYVDLVCGCNHCEVIQRGGDLPGRDHIVCAMISNLSCDQLLGELEVGIFVCKKS